jgi:hypothetical protein
LLAWRPISHQQHIFYLSGPELWKKDLKTTWARERAVSATEPPGGGWISLGGNIWVRPILVSNIVKSSTVQLAGQTWEAQVVNSNPVSNGRHLTEVLEGVVDATGCGIDAVVSNFFGVNPDATQPDNGVYEFAVDNLQNVFVYQKSDIVRATASNDATKMEMSLQEFLNDMRVLNVLWSIEDVGGTVTLRIEHYTYWQAANGLDLTAPEYEKFIVGLDSFTTDDDVPAFESFAYQESFRPKFLVQRVDYPAPCATSPGSEVVAGLLCADFGGLVENPDAGLEGFFLMASHDLGGGEYLINTLGGEANGCFSLHSILPELWADGRFHAGATSTVPDYTVESVRKQRTQSQITVRWCCDNEFSPSELVQTQLGWGEVKAAEHDTRRAALKLTLLQ